MVSHTSPKIMLFVLCKSDRRQSNYYSFCACLEIDSDTGLFSLEPSQECVHCPRHAEVFPNSHLLRCVATKNVGLREKGREGLPYEERGCLGHSLQAL